MDPEFDYDALYELPKKTIFQVWPEITHRALADLTALLKQGYWAGLQGWYKDLDYSSDAAYCNGPAREMARLEAEHGLSEEAVFVLFTDAHAQGLADENRLIYVMLRSGVEGGSPWEIMGVRDSPEEIKKLQGNTRYHDWRVEVHAVRDRVPQEDDV